MDWYDDLVVNELKVTALPVVHWSRRVGFDHNTSLWAGFAFKGPDHHLFFGGDSGYGPVFKETGERYGPFDTALLGIGAYAPREMMKASHATPEEAVQMGQDLKAKTLVGMHWGTVVLTQEPPFEPPERFVAAGKEAGLADEAVWVMKIGESRPLAVTDNAGWPSNAWSAIPKGRKIALGEMAMAQPNRRSLFISDQAGIRLQTIMLPKVSSASRLLSGRHCCLCVAQCVPGTSIQSACALAW